MSTASGDSRFVSVLEVERPLLPCAIAGRRGRTVSSHDRRYAPDTLVRGECFSATDETRVEGRQLEPMPGRGTVSSVFESGIVR